MEDPSDAVSPNGNGPAVEVACVVCKKQLTEVEGARTHDRDGRCGMCHWKWAKYGEDVDLGWALEDSFPKWGEPRSPRADVNGHKPSRNGNGNGPHPPAEPEDLLVDMRAAMADADQPFEYPLSPIAARGFLTILVGRRSSYKTWLAMLGAHAVHSGRDDLAGLRCDRTTCLYVDAENGARLMGKRFKSAGIPPDGLLVADGSQVRLPGNVAKLGRLIEHTGAGLVVLDSLRTLAPGVKENDSDSMAPLITAIKDLTRQHNAAVVLIHHRSSKSGAADVRGSSAIEDQADLIFSFEHKGRGVCVLEPLKFRIDQEPDSRWFQFRSALDLESESGRRFVVESAEALPDTPKPLTEPQQTVLDVLTTDVQSVREIQAAAGLGNPGTTQRILKALEERGLAERRVDGWVLRVASPLGDATPATPQHRWDEEGDR